MRLKAAAETSEPSLAKVARRRHNSKLSSPRRSLLIQTLLLTTTAIHILQATQTLNVLPLKAILEAAVIQQQQSHISRPPANNNNNNNNGSLFPPSATLPGFNQLQLQLEQKQRRNQNQNPNQNLNPNENQSGRHNTKHTLLAGHAWPHSSSSFFAAVEDLQDSSIRTRAGDVQPAQTEPADFDRLMERIAQQTADQQAQPHRHFHILSNFYTGNSNSKAPSFKVAADANNKTTMRFFRNNKTFASIVYTNGNADHNNNNGQQQQQQQPLKTPERQPRRLINCHLVDLEKHSSDVALFESKYEIRTVDVEFKEMMQLIEQCTNIARFKPIRPLVGNLKPNVAQLFAASLPDNAHQQPPHQHKAVRMQMQMQTANPARPIIVVGRPLPLAVAGQQPMSTFQKVMSGALNQELQKLPAVVDDSSKLDLPKTQQQRSRRNYYNQQRYRAGSGLLKKVQETSKKLVLGEVTPPASVVDSRQGGIKEALQEITSYDTTDLLAIWRGILPGTNWCGMGDRATSYNDLGFESDIDICCRAHDFCPIRLSAFSAGYGLFNWSFYTRSHCWCDQNFLNCLQRAESPLSSVVMKFYFTIMKTTCLHDNETATSQGGLQQAAPMSIFSASARMPRFELMNLAPTPQQQHQTQMSPEQVQFWTQVASALPIPALKQSQVVGSRAEKSILARN